MGLRIPKDARGWGVPAIAWFGLAPYFALGALMIGRRIYPVAFDLTPTPGIPYVDVLALCYVLLGVYVVLISIAIMAPAVTRERERETWESLRLSVSSPHEILLGLLCGRLGPILAAHLATGLLWVLLRPHYAPLFQGLSPFTLDAPTLALLVWEVFLAALAAGLMATAFSVYSKTTGLALVLSAGGLLVSAAVSILLVLFGPLSGPVALLAWNLLLAAVSYALAVRGLR